MLSESFIKASDELSTFERPVPAPYLRREFTLDFAPEAAELTVTGLGFYELFLNGKNITKGILAPYISNSDELVVYDAYDLLPYLKKGKNCIGLILGDGFRNNIGGFIWDFQKASCRGPLCAALSFSAKGEGKELAFEADETFRTHPSAILFNDERLGYTYDSNKEISGWSEPGFDDSSWEPAKACIPPRGEKVLSYTAPVRIRRRIAPVKIEHFDELAFCSEMTAEGVKPYEDTVRRDVYVYDFGVNSSGLTELHIHGKPGQVITVRHGETLFDGKFSNRSTLFIRANGIRETYLEHAQKDVFILKGGEETLLPHFKYDGFRYAFVEGLTPEQAKPETLTFAEAFSDHAERGAFSCSDADLNRLYEMGRRSDLSNFVFFPTDCPHREKNGWTADASVSAEQMMLQLECGESLRLWMNEIANTQRLDGALPGIVPTGGWGYKWGNGPSWDSVAFSIPLAVYQFDGDRKIIEQNVPLMMRYLTYIQTRRDERGLIAIGLGDWVDPDWEDGPIKSPLVVTDSIMTYHNAKRAEFLFREIGKKIEADYAAAVAAGMREAIRKHLVDFGTMTVEGDCQTSQAFAIYAGIFEPEEEPKAFEKLLAIIKKDGETSRCGVVGLRCLFRVLDKYGENELAYRLIVSRKFGCVGKWLDNPEETTLLESFPKQFEMGFPSHNHHFLGDFLAWMTYSIAGLRPNTEATDTAAFEIRPTFLEKLSHAEAYFVAKLGEEKTPARLEAAWKKTEGGATVTVTVPGGMHGRFFCPKGYCSDLDGKELPAGRREIFCKKA